MSDLKERREWLAAKKNNMISRLGNKNLKGFERVLKMIELYNNEIRSITKEVGDGRYHI